MTLVYDPRPIEPPDYWAGGDYPCYLDFCELVADELFREYDHEVSADQLKNNYYIKREYYLGESAEATAQLFYEFEVIWED